MRKISLLLSFVLFVILGYAQPKIQFDQTTYDFGSIKEEGGRVTGRFEFTNVGDSPLILTQVKPGCGCTAANYTKEEIAPGGRGFIDATYDPYNRPGNFNKNIKVKTNEPKFDDPKAQPILIFIKGVVIKRPPTVFEEAGYKSGSGMVRFKEPSVKFSLLNTQSHVDTFQIRNFWDRNVKIELVDLPEYITEVYRSFGNEIKPAEEGFIVFKYDASKQSAWGIVKDGITVLTNDSIEQKKRIHFSVEINEDFSKLTEKQLKEAPVCVVEATQLNFGSIEKNSIINKEVLFTNTGKSPLIIRQVNTTMGSLSAKMEKMTLNPNESAKLYISFNSKNRRGKLTASIDIVTNDPNNSKISIQMNGEILQ